MKYKKFKILLLDIRRDDLKFKNKKEFIKYQNKYIELFSRPMGLAKSYFTVADAAQERLPNFQGFQGVIIGGSRHNALKREEKDWMKRVYIFIRQAVKQKMPLLGICGGHQFIARALGGEIVYHPQGREFGTIDIRLTPAGQKDDLFKGLPRQFKANSNHRCMIRNLKPTWKLLASSNFCRIQALSINKQTRIIQFHPEISARGLRKRARNFKDIFIKEGLLSDASWRDFLKSLRDTPYAAKVLKNFRRYFIKKYQPKY